MKTYAPHAQHCCAACGKGGHGFICCPCSCRSRDEKTRDGCVGVIGSVALAETGLAHILNAEGEKIQRMLEVSACPCDLLAVNSSVSETLARVTELERVLYEKLKLAGDILTHTKTGDLT
jgi:hypothetical protein